MVPIAVGQKNGCRGLPFPGGIQHPPDWCWEIEVGLGDKEVRVLDPVLPCSTTSDRFFQLPSLSVLVCKIEVWIWSQFPVRIK